MLFIFSLITPYSFAQAPFLKKTPADFAYQYDNQYPKPRQSLAEERLNRKTRQGAFARQLVRTMALEGSLPLAASEADCIQMLRDSGIAPLKGWDRYAPLTDDDYSVIVGKAIGKEYDVHENAQFVCDQIVKLLNVEWSLHFAQHDRYPLLEKLITNKSIFPVKEPRCPYGEIYKIGRFKRPYILLHKHIIQTPLRKYLYRTKNIFKKIFPGEKTK